MTGVCGDRSAKSPVGVRCPKRCNDSDYVSEAALATMIRFMSAVAAGDVAQDFERSTVVEHLALYEVRHPI